MELENLISIDQFCTFHTLELDFVISLQDHQLIDLILVDNVFFLHIDNLPKIERIVRLHEELAINLEGIDVIIQLLEKNEQLQEELKIAQQRLARFTE